MRRAKRTNLSWPIAPDVTTMMLEERLFSKAGFVAGVRRRAEADWASIVRDMKRLGVYLIVLWEEYRAVHPAGYGYSRFCDLFRELERRLSPSCASLIRPAINCSSIIPARGSASPIR